MIFPCPNKVQCPGTDFPITNYTSEQSDGPTFIGLKWGNGAIGVCESTVDQSTADLCAGQDLCKKTITGQIYQNGIESTTVTCPDGTPFTFATAPNLFCGDTQGAADAYAQGYANQQAPVRLFCLGCPPGTKCALNVPASFQLSALGNLSGTVQYSLVSGSLPPGLSLSSAGLISGIPTTNGTYNFMVQGVNAVGDFMQKSCQIISGTGVAPCVPGTCSGTFEHFDIPTCQCQLDYPIQICNWPAVLAAITFPASWLNSGLPAWNGQFTGAALSLTTPGLRVFYFLGQSIGGKQVCPGDGTTFYPGADWWDFDCFTQLQYFAPFNVWNLAFNTTNCANPNFLSYQMASTDPHNPNGLYTLASAVGMTGPATLTIQRLVDGAC